jgi:hypothetical protein
LTALGLFVRNYLTVLRADRQVRELAERLNATCNTNTGATSWPGGSKGRATNCRCIARVGQARADQTDAQRRYSPSRCKLAKRPSEAQLAPGAVDTGPFALGHRRFDQIGRVIGITNLGVKEHLTAGDREDVAARLLRDGFIEIEMNGNTIAAERADALRAEDLTAERVADWARKLAQL